MKWHLYLDDRGNLDWSLEPPCYTDHRTRKLLATKDADEEPIDKTLDQGKQAR